MKNNFKIKEYDTRKFLIALKEAICSSKELFSRAQSMDAKVTKNLTDFNELVEVIDSYFDKENPYGQVDGKYKLMPYGRVCLNLGNTKSDIFLEVCITTALTYNSALIYAYSMENYAVNMYIITLVNETLKRFLAMNYIVFQIGEAPRVKNVFYIEFDSDLQFFEKRNSKPQTFELKSLLVKSRI